MSHVVSPKVLARPRMRPDPADELALLESIAEVARGETIELTEEEAEHFYATGELSERIERWAASRE
jgi:hypothetical protein